MSDPVTVPKAPANWRMSADQMSRVAQDPRLHHLSHDELYIFFNPPHAQPKSGNVFADYVQKAMKYLGVPTDWMDQAFSWHPANTIGKASNALSEINDRANQ